ncbi:MAG TPA: STAS domain-containing protein [Rubrivivax sp.]|nr:STAS domain-containing protein [Rubrivivax sp.]HPO21093.1 STAS domain-containing protein [Rubrivivax sp.]
MKLPPTLTLDTAADALRALQAEPAGAGGAALTVDASALARFDTAALALLLQARRQAQAAGRGFVVQGAPAALVQLARLYGVQVLLGLAAE